MHHSRRIAYLLCVLIAMSLIIAASSVVTLYRTALVQTGHRLLETAQSHARLIESTSRLHASQEGEARREAILTAIRNADSEFSVKELSREFVIGRREGADIVFLDYRPDREVEVVGPIPWDADFAEPMRLALSGLSGTVIAKDYLGTRVLAAYEPLGDFNWGIVYKVDLTEVRAPFIRAAAVSFMAIFVVTTLGVWFLWRLSVPLIRELQTNEEQMRAIVENAMDGIITIDERGLVKTFNPEAERLFGYTREDVIGRNISMLMTEPDMANHDSYLKRYLGTGENRIIDINREIKCRRKSGDTFPARLAVKEYFVAGERSFVGTIQDLTAHKESEESLTAAKNAAEQANYTKSRFLSSMSHELRTPLNGILGFSDLLMEQYFGSLNEKQIEYVSLIDTSGKHLLTLINDLLDIAKIDADAMDLYIQEIHAPELVDIPVEMMKSQILKKRLKVTRYTDPALRTIEADPRKYKQIMLNLLSNAIKYTSKGGSIEVRAEALAEGWVRVSVADTGVGIEPEEQSKIFDEFHQVDRKRDEHLGGTGIGLALTRRLVEMHGGSIGVDSVANEGSVFWFTLPPQTERRATDVVPSDDVMRSADVPTGRRILVAEDNETNLSLILDMLAVHQHEIVVVRNGAEAVEMAQSFNPELVIMDIRMPVMDGIEATKKLRGMPQFESLPILALTASADETTARHCMESGCTAHFPKPIQSELLYVFLAEYLGNGSSTGEKTATTVHGDEKV